MPARFELDTLRAHLRSVPAAEVEPLARQFVKENGGDEADFLLWLHETGRIGSDELRDAMASLDVSFTLSEGLASNAPAASKHRVLGVLGRGAMGEVLIARDEELRRNVALKRMHPGLADEPALARRFLTEVQITAQLDHPAIVPVYAVDRGEDGRVGYTMKLVRGRTLKEFMADARAFGERRQRPDDAHALPARVELFLQICEPLAYAHARGVIHRDLKPDNIMVGSFGEIFVMDWGIARLVGGTEPITTGAAGDDRIEQTEAGVVVGTPSYMSPEQADGRNDELDGRSDIFSLGLILFELATLRRARASVKGLAMMLAASQGRIDPIVAASPRERVPREVVAVIRKATAKRRRDRYPTVEALIDDVRRALRGQAVGAQPDTIMQRFSRWIAHHREASAAIVLGLVLLLVVVAALGFGGSVVAAEVSRDRAAKREARLSSVLALTSAQARAMDRQFQRFEGLLHGLAFTTERVLQSPAETQPVYLPADYATPGNGPPDLAESEVYGPASFDHMDFAFAPLVDPEKIRSRLYQLSALQPYFQRVLLQSHTEDAMTLDAAGRRHLVLDEGVPVVWTYVALEEGVIAALPGTGVYPKDYDPRRRPWYSNARHHRLPHWGAVYLDESGMGLLLDCGTGLYDQGGAFLGVAALDITVGFLVDTLLEPAGLAAPVEAYLVGEDGNIVAQSSLKELAKTGKDYVPVPLPYPSVLEAVRGGTRAGHAEIGEELLTWTRLDAVPWTYLVVGKTEELVGG